MGVSGVGQISGRCGSGGPNDGEFGKERDAPSWFIEAEPVTQIGEEGDAELSAGLHQPEHDVTGLAAVSTHGAARDATLGSAGAQIAFGRIGRSKCNGGPNDTQGGRKDASGWVASMWKRDGHVNEVDLGASPQADQNVSRFPDTVSLETRKGVSTTKPCRASSSNPGRFTFVSWVIPIPPEVRLFTSRSRGVPAASSIVWRLRTPVSRNVRATRPASSSPCAS